MKKSRIVPLLFIGALVLPGCGSSVPSKPASSYAAPANPVRYVNCPSCNQRNNLPLATGKCVQCSQSLVEYVAEAEKNPDSAPASGGSHNSGSAAATGTSSSTTTTTHSTPHHGYSTPIIFFGGGGGSHGFSSSGTRTPTSPSGNTGFSTGTSPNRVSPGSDTGSSSSTVTRGGFGSSSRSSAS